MFFNRLRIFVAVVLVCGISFQVPQSVYAATQENFSSNRLVLPDTPATVSTATGQFVGKKDQYGITSFKGIPYAKAPVGNLRWKPPVAVEPSNEVIQATKFGPTTVQAIMPFEDDVYKNQSENCLSLNVWTRDVTAKGKAVMVFIHGGSFISGGSADPLYNLENFVRRNDVVMVSVNYRVGLLGFLNLNDFAGSEYADSPNLGMMDQVQALKWVHENISKFGGDANNVTLFGESCGAASVSLLMAMPDAKGLFQKVIAESGGNHMVKRDINFSKDVAKDFISITGAKTMDDLLALSEDQIRDAGAKMHDKYFPNETYCFPLVDGRSIPVDPYEAIKNGSAAGVKLLIGSNEDEVYLWKHYMRDFIHDAEGFGRATYSFMGLKIDQHPDIMNEYYKMPLTLNTSESSHKVALVAELGFRLPAIKMAEAQSKYNDTYMYYWKWKSQIPDMKAAHAVELPFVFYNFELPSVANWVGPNLPESLAADTQDAWVAFAVTGNPSHKYIPQWPKYDGNNRSTMTIGNEWKVVDDPGQKERILLDPLFKDTKYYN